MCPFVAAADDVICCPEGPCLGAGGVASGHVGSALGTDGAAVSLEGPALGISGAASGAEGPATRGGTRDPFPSKRVAMPTGIVGLLSFRFSMARGTPNGTVFLTEPHLLQSQLLLVWVYCRCSSLPSVSVGVVDSSVGVPVCKWEDCVSLGGSLKWGKGTARYMLVILNVFISFRWHRELSWTGL